MVPNQRKPWKLQVNMGMNRDPDTDIKEGFPNRRRWFLMTRLSFNGFKMIRKSGSNLDLHLFNLESVLRVVLFSTTLPPLSVIK